MNKSIIEDVFVKSFVILTTILVFATVVYTTFLGDHRSLNQRVLADEFCCPGTMNCDHVIFDKDEMDCVYGPKTELSKAKQADEHTIRIHVKTLNEYGWVE